jgi:hypothetical protein
MQECDEQFRDKWLLPEKSSKPIQSGASSDEEARKIFLNFIAAAPV